MSDVEAVDVWGEDETPEEPFCVCASCGVALVNHLGHQGTCAHLLATRAALQKIRETLDGTFTLGDIAEAVADGLKASE